MNKKLLITAIAFSLTVSCGVFNNSIEPITYYPKVKTTEKTPDKPVSASTPVVKESVNVAVKVRTDINTNDTKGSLNNNTSWQDYYNIPVASSLPISSITPVVSSPPVDMNLEEDLKSTIKTPEPLPLTTPKDDTTSNAPINNSLKNGDFENGLNYWKKIYEGKGQQSINVEAVTAREHQLHLKVQDGQGSIGVYQDVNLNKFKSAIFRADLYTDGAEGLYWGMGMPGVSGVSIDYRTKIGEYLGSTVIANYQHNPFEGTFLGVPKPPSSNNSNHYITINNGTWNRKLVVDIVKEINENLPEIAIEDIEQMTITLFASTSNNMPQTLADLLADNLSLEIEPMTIMAPVSPIRIAGKD